MKFYVVVKYYLASLNIKFHEDPRINVRARVLNARIHNKKCVRAFTTRVHAFVQKSS